MAEGQVLDLAFCPRQHFVIFYCKAFMLLLQVIFSYCNFYSVGVKLEVNSFCFVLWVLEALRRSWSCGRSLHLPREAKMASPH